MFRYYNPNPALESVMGDATNDYERRMVINAINDIQTGKSGK